MPYYESVFIARPDISSAQVDALSEGFKSIVDENGGKVTKSEYWGLKTLAYRIKKSRKGHYAMMNLDAPANAVAEMERNMRLNEDVIRFMTVRVDALEEGPSIVLRSRGSRDDRGGRDRDRGDRGRRDGDRDARPPREGDRESRNRGEAESAKPDDSGAAKDGEKA